MVIYVNYGKKLYQLIDRYGKTNIEISNLIKISDSLYSRYEKEEQTTIPIKHLNTLSNYFNVSIDYIFGFTNIKKYKNLRENINIELSSQRLKSIIKENNLTQIKLADILNVDNSMLAKYEKGKYIIATTYLYQICKKYNISADYLLGKIDSPKYLNK